MRQVKCCSLILSLILLSGCGQSAPEGPELIEVTGTISFKGEPLADANLLFIPVNDTSGVGGEARSDSAGKFQINYLRGGTGLPAGTYRVAVSRRMMPDGTPVPPNDDTPPIESPAKETLPAKYTNPELSQLKVDIAEGKPLEISLDS